MCQSISFNYLGTIMATSLNNKIKIWNFLNGKCDELTNLEGHQCYVTCLKFSNYQNTLFSSDHLIVIWKYTQLQCWKSFETKLGHKHNILCMILNKNENSLITGGADYIIKVWSLDLENLMIKEQYLLNKHQDSVLSLDLNQSQNILVSCGEDRQIIIWRKEKQNQWYFSQIVTQSFVDFGCRLAFLTDHKFIWVSSGESGQACLNEFEIQDENFQENQNSTIYLQNKDDLSDYGLFPIVYNQLNEILVVKHKYSIYILKLTFDRGLIIVEEIRCQDLATFGILTNDGKFLIFWQNFEKQFYIYQLQGYK
ncbi:unnamed protein product [Paramecium sonneborni]|uniref:Uncharacterized protein n=1 Tax=Paramecium sonneborni TaxID=65129 RepID=A0A8S1P0U3_9CILI|nr:unnamed protein product [Paramecium sonneborni]